MARELTPEELNLAKRKQKSKIASNPLRRVLLLCAHGWVRDSDAQVKDWVWCESCNDFARVSQVVE